MEHKDVVIVGAGICGITAAYYISKNCPNKTYVLLEARDRVGGTWDLFKYPGIRSDSDMFTFGFSFRPWTKKNIIAPGADILSYIHDTMDSCGITPNTRCGEKVATAEFSSADGLWRITTAMGKQYTASYFFSCTGYYRYDQGYTPDFKGRDRFQGKVMHPQHWDEDFDYSGKRVVVIGSGATAATIVPVMGLQAASVTMLQRSPGYFVAAPARGDPFDHTVSRLLSMIHPVLGFKASRWKHIYMQAFLYQVSRYFPQTVKQMVMAGIRRQCPEGFDVDTHFNPKYNPWDERLCACPGGDFFKALRRNQADVVTGHINTFTEDGIQLTDGRELPADLIVTATGFHMQSNFPVNDIAVKVDGVLYDAASKVLYKDMMLSDMPNFFFVLGYLQESLTLKAELVAGYVTRIINHMDQYGYTQCMPTGGEAVQGIEFLGLKSSYLQRSKDRLPSQAKSSGWNLYGTYMPDLVALSLRGVDDGHLAFSAGEDCCARPPDTAAPSGCAPAPTAGKARL